MSESLTQEPEDEGERPFDFNREVNLRMFVALRAVVFAGVLAALLFFFIMGAPIAELTLFFTLGVIWFIGSFAIEAFVVAVGRTLKLRCGLFAIVDMYLILSLFSHAGGALLPAASAFAGYTLLASASCGLFVGVLAAATGLTAFVQGYFLDIDIGPDSLILAALLAAAALFAAFLWKNALPGLIAKLNKGNRNEAALRKSLAAAQTENKQLNATVADMQKRLDILGKERDDALNKFSNDEASGEKEAAQPEQPAEPEKKEEPEEQETKEEPAAQQEPPAEEKPAGQEEPAKADEEKDEDEVLIEAAFAEAEKSGAAEEQKKESPQ